MSQKNLLCISAVLFSYASFACSCSIIEEFNLVSYDYSRYVFEVKIESKIDTVNYIKAYNISMIEVFKGDLKLSEKTMSFPNFSSCSWTPDIGFTYIFYANSLNEIEMCDRKIFKEYEETIYQEERSILCSLMDKEPILKIKQDENILIEGYHVNGKRHGIWKIYSIDKEQHVAYKISYANGKLLSVEKGKGYTKANESLSYYDNYFKYQLLKSN